MPLGKLIWVFIIGIPLLGSAQGLTILYGTGVNHTFSSNFGAGVSYYDWNKDGWPDLSFCNNLIDPQFFLNNNGTFEPVDAFIPNNGKMRSLIWVDYDNDGDADMAVSRHDGLFSLYRNDNFEFTDVSAEAGFPLTSFKSYGNTWADYDRDGYLDVYLAIYDHAPGIENILLRNNGDGTFTDKTVESGTGNGNQFSFNGLWIDVNNDQWPDLHVANDKFHPNTLYINNGDGTFTDVSEWGDIMISADPMSNTAGDYNNDGNLDIFMSNSVLPSILLKGLGNGTFYNSAADAGVDLGIFAWGSIFSDLNLDRNEDLLVCTGNQVMQQYPSQLYMNDGDGTFTNRNDLFPSGLNNAYSVAEGDYDMDGDNDLVVLNGLSYFSQLFRNDFITGNQIKISLEGQISNRDGIGSWIEWYCHGERRVRYTFCGENYMSQNAQYEILALGEHSQADSLIIRWPSGFTDTYYSLSAGTCKHLREGSSLRIHLGSMLSLCEGDTINLDAGDFDSYHWNTGSESRTIEVHSPGTYFVTAYQSGLPVLSDTVMVLVHPLPQVIAQMENIHCHGGNNGSISLSPGIPDEIFSYLWNHGAISPEISNLGAGTYTVEITDSHNCHNTFAFLLEEPDSLHFASISANGPSCYGDSLGSILFSGSGGTPPYQALWDQNVGEFALSGLGAGSYHIEIIDSFECSSDTIIFLDEPEPLSLALNISDLNAGFSMAQADISGGTAPYYLYFQNETGEVNPNSLLPGWYSLTVTDSHGCLADTLFEVQSPTGIYSDYGFPFIQLSPNPASDELRIWYHGDPIPLQLYLFDNSGRHVAWTRIETDRKYTILNTGKLSPGLYYYHITDNLGRIITSGKQIIACY